MSLYYLTIGFLSGPLPLLMTLTSALASALTSVPNPNDFLAVALAFSYALLLSVYKYGKLNQDLVFVQGWFVYSSIIFLLAASRPNKEGNLFWFILKILICFYLVYFLFCLLLGKSNYLWFVLTGCFFVLAVIFLLTYLRAKQDLTKSFSKFHSFAILAAISSIGLFLGWLTYQFFPIFPNR